jgi:membrane protein implicated in regulation of membrane protease activity
MEMLFTLIVSVVVSVFVWRAIRAQQEREDQEHAQDRGLQ